MDIPDFRDRFRKPTGIVIGLVCQFVFLPVAGFLSIRLFYANDPVHGIPLLVTVCSPGGSYSNWWCSLFNSDLPLSMAMTSASSLFAVATLPINVLIYLKLSYPSEESAVSLDWGGLFTSLAVVVVGIIWGLFLGSKKPRWRGKLNAAGNASGVALVLLGFFFSSNSSAPIWARTSDFYFGIAMPCVFGLLLSLAFSKLCGLPKPHCLSVTIETCYQNTAIPLAVILSSFSNDDTTLCESLGRTPRQEWRDRIANGEDASQMPPPCDVIGIAAGVPTFYQVAQIVSLGFICLVGWKSGWTYAPPSHGFYRVLTRNYQPGAADPEPDRIRHEEHEGEGLSGCSCCFPRGGGVLEEEGTTGSNGRDIDDRQNPSGAGVDSINLDAVQLAEVTVEDRK